MRDEGGMGLLGGLLGPRMFGRGVGSFFGLFFGLFLRRGRGFLPLFFERLALGGFVFGHAALFIFFPAAAMAGVVAAQFDTRRQLGSSRSGVFGRGAAGCFLLVGTFFPEHGFPLSVKASVCGRELRLPSEGPGTGLPE